MNEKIICVIGNEPITMTKAAEIKRMYEVECSAEYIEENYPVDTTDAHLLASLLRDFMLEADYPISEEEALYKVVFEKKYDLATKIIEKLEPLRKEAVANGWC